MKKITFYLVFILACNLVVAQNYFIKFDGIDGESKNETYQGWSEIESFNQELASGIKTVAGARTRGMAVLGNTISIVKKIDKSSPKLLEALTRGKRIGFVEMEISRFNNDGATMVIYKYRLENVTVTRYNVMGNNSELPAEEIAIAFEKQKVIYTEYDEKGRSRGNIETEYDTRKNQ